MNKTVDFAVSKVKNHSLLRQIFCFTCVSIVLEQYYKERTLKLLQSRQYKNNTVSKKNRFFENVKMKFRCFAAVTIRSLCPYEKQVKNNLKKNGNRIIRAASSTLISFILALSKLNVGMMPFGLSAICASFGKNAVFSFCGAAAACLFEGIDGIVQFISFFLVYLVRKSVTDGAFNEKLLYRVLITFLSSVFIGACTILSDGLGASIILSYIAYVFLSVSGVYLFSGIFIPDKCGFSNGLYLLSIYSVCVCMIPAFNRMSFQNVDFGLMTAAVLTLMFSKSKGPVYGCVAGFIFGFACINPLCSAPLGIAGLVSGYVFTLKTAAALLAFPLTSFFAYVYLFGFSDFLMFFPFVASGAILYSAFYKYLPDFFTVRKTLVTKQEEKRIRKSNEFEKVSDSLSGLSAILYKFAEHLKAPGSAETGYVIDSAFNEICKSCSMNSMCYAKRECNFPAVRKQLVTTLHSRQIKEEELSSLLLNKCIKPKELSDYINLHYSELNFITMKSNRTGTVASLYSSMSRLIKNTSAQAQENRVRDEKLERAVSAGFEKIGLEFSYVTAYGSRCKDVFVHGVRADKIPCSAKELSQYLSSECNMTFSEPEFDISDSADMVMHFSRSNVLNVDYAQSCISKNKGNVNGDTLSFFETDKGYFYSIIADGMGSGKTAAATSRLSCVFLEKMLTAGTAKNVCIELLNNLLLSKNDETFSGIDLLEIDKLTSSAYFIKAGAAASFILRNGRLYKISSETPPVGIIPSFSAESTRFSLERGDLIIMASDGIVQSDSDAVWISELVLEEKEKEPALLANNLMEKAKTVNKRRDDMSVCVIRIG